MSKVDEEKIKKDYNSIIAELKNANGEAELMDDKNASSIEKKLRDKLFTLNTFSAPQTLESEELKNLDKVFKTEKKKLLSNISLALAKQKKYDEAVKNEKKVMKLDENDDNKESYKRILEWYITSKKEKEAKEFVEEIKKKFEGKEEDLKIFKKYFDIIEGKGGEEAKKYLENDKKPANPPKEKESIMQYVWMILLALALRFVIRFLKKKFGAKAPLEPTNEKPAGI